MKFEKFLKNAGMCGAIVDCEQYGKFLNMGTVMMRIPDGANVLAAFKRKMRTVERDIFTAYEDGDTYTAELTGATLPTPDAKPSQIERILAIRTALVITEGYGDDETIVGVIFSGEYYMNTMES